MTDRTPQQLFAALAEFYPPTGAEYVACLQKAGYSEEQIAADYQKFIQPQPDRDAFVAAMEQRIEEVNR